MKFSTQIDTDKPAYSILGPDGIGGPVALFGQPAALMYDDELYYCVMKNADDDPIIFRLDRGVKIESEIESGPGLVAEYIEELNNAEYAGSEESDDDEDDDDDDGGDDPDGGEEVETTVRNVA